jgi:hypothetical protein
VNGREGIRAADEVDGQEGAYADVTLKVGLVKVLQKEFNLCQEAYVCRSQIHVAVAHLALGSREANLTMQCPVATGDFKVAHTVTLPKEIPPGTSVVLQPFSTTHLCVCFSAIHGYSEGLQCRR